MLFIYILFNIIYSLLKEIVAFLCHLTSAKPEIPATITVLIFIFVAILIVVISIFGLFLTKATYSSVTAWLLQVFAVIMYYCGDNIQNILYRYGKSLKCGTYCQNNSRIAVITLLASALLIQYNIPHQKQGEDKAPKAKDKLEWWNYAFNIVTVFVSTTIIYSLVSSFPPISDNTSLKMFLVICIIIGCILIVVNLCLSQNKNMCRNRAYSLTIISFSLAFCLPLYLLSNNKQPLDSIISCHSSPSNATIEQEVSLLDYDCNNWVNSIWRLVFLSISTVIILCVSGIFLCRWCTERRYNYYEKVNDTDTIN